MELSSLSENIIPVPYKRGNDELILQVNIDAFTPEFWRKMRARAEEKLKALEREIALAVKESSKPEVKGKRTPKKLTKAQKAKEAEELFQREMQSQLEELELKARTLEIQRETNIEFLFPHILKDWDVIEKGMPVKLTKQVLTSLPPKLVQEIFDICVKATHTVKKKEDEEREETSENSPSGTRAPLALAPTG